MTKERDNDLEFDFRKYEKASAASQMKKDKDLFDKMISHQKTSKYSAYPTR